jgi:hypothetical protein
MTPFSQWLNERAEDPKTPEPADITNKVAVVNHAWSQLELMLQKYQQIMATVKAAAPEVVTDLSVKVEEAINSDRNLSDRDKQEIMNIIQSHNRFSKFTYLKPWPKKQPDWWTGPKWEQ